MDIEIATNFIKDIRALNGCIIMTDKYSVNQDYILSSSSANLSNTAARNDIFLINSRILIDKIIEDVLNIDDLSCA